jgi:hypothetical protein
LFRLYCSTFDEKTELVFELYDFDGDGYITKNDISTILSSLPVINFNRQSQGSVEGKFTQEGGGLDNFMQRVETMDEMNKILDQSFEGKTRIDPMQFKRMNEEISSDTVLAVLGLFREKLPCSENFWRYKRNYDQHMKGAEKPSLDTASTASERQPMKRIASPKMRHVRALSPYNRENAGAT